jgi:hypothetical protein
MSKPIAASRTIWRQRAYALFRRVARAVYTMPPVKRRLVLPVLALTLALLPALGVAAAAKPSQPTMGPNGPIGWDVYRRLSDLPRIPRGVHAAEFSSYDRSGGNDDGFSGAYSCLHLDADGCVIAEHNGPGEIDSIWFTRDGGDVSATGKIKIQLDGRTVVNAPLQEVVDGALGPPFVYPVVANADQSSGGVYIKAPMPFRSRMRITSDQNPRFYHVNYRTFGSTRGVRTFDPTRRALGVISKLSSAGISDPKSRARGSRTTKGTFRLAPGQKATLARLRGPGAISALRVRIPQLVGPQPATPITDDGRAFGAGGWSQFTISIEPSNDGVRLTRRLDTVIGNQRAQVFVGGAPAGEWAPLPATGNGQWRDESVELPASLTAGKSQITVRNEFVSSNYDFNEFTYWADSHAGGGLMRTDTVDVGPDSLGSEAAHAYSIQNETWQGTRTYEYPPSGNESHITASADLLRNVRLAITFDGRRTVNAPLGEFFGTGLGEYPVKALMFAVSTSPHGWYSSWWPMPYRSSARVRLVNRSAHAITSSRSRVVSARSPRWRRKLGPHGRAGYFEATSRRGPTTPGIDWPFLEATGRGKLVGISQTMEGPNRTYLEGDEIGHVEGSTTAQLHGTGTEDFYEGGWYWNRGPFTDPLNGEPSHEEGLYGCAGVCDSAYRLMLAEAIPFTSSIDFGIEHGTENTVQGLYSSTAYWYKRP